MGDFSSQMTSLQLLKVLYKQTHDTSQQAQQNIDFLEKNQPLLAQKVDLFKMTPGFGLIPKILETKLPFGHENPGSNK